MTITRAVFLPGEDLHLLPGMVSPRLDQLLYLDDVDNGVTTTNRFVEWRPPGVTVTFEANFHATDPRTAGVDVDPNFGEVTVDATLPAPERLLALPGDRHRQRRDRRSGHHPHPRAHPRRSARRVAHAQPAGRPSREQPGEPPRQRAADRPRRVRRRAIRRPQQLAPALLHRPPRPHRPPVRANDRAARRARPAMEVVGSQHGLHQPDDRLADLPVLRERDDLPGEPHASGHQRDRNRRRPRSVERAPRASPGRGAGIRPDGRCGEHPVPARGIHRGRAGGASSASSGRSSIGCARAGAPGHSTS